MRRTGSQSRWGQGGLCCAAVLASLVATSSHARPVLDGSRLAALSRYQVLVFGDPEAHGIERGKAIAVIDALPEEVFRVATDYAKYQDFMPHVRSSVVLAENNGLTLVKIAAELPWPAGSTWVDARYRTEKLAGGIYRVRFDMVRGSMRRYVGSLYIEPWTEQQTAVTYELVAEPNTLAPRSTVNRGILRSTGKFVHALRQRIGELHRLGRLHPEPLPVKREPSPLVGPLPPAALGSIKAAN